MLPLILDKRKPSEMRDKVFQNADFLNISLEYLLAETDKNVFYKSESPTTFHYRIEQLRKEKNEKYSTICRSMPFQKNSFYEWLRTGSLDKPPAFL